MSTINNDVFDYQAHVRGNSPSAVRIQRGADARRQRFEAAIARLAVRLDEDVLEQFQQLVAQGEGYERLVNQALREWLSARDVKELVRAELQQVIRQALSTAQTGAKLPRKLQHG